CSPGRNKYGTRNKSSNLDNRKMRLYSADFDRRPNSTVRRADLYGVDSPYSPYGRRSSNDRTTPRIRYERSGSAAPH
ncbi:hypothetical protein PMAYCL1PPCAC_32711, partial [Pristionchus mayeri]